MSKKYHLRRREFLNLDVELRAYVIAVVEDARDKHVGRGISDDDDEYLDISLRIADCRREIYLYFDLDTQEERENSLHKIRTLADVINEFKLAIEREIQVISARESVPRHSRAASAVH